jgi:hypothetical protein
MNQQPSPINCGNKSSTLSQIFDALDEALGRQMKFTAQGNLAAAQEVVEQIGEMIAQLLLSGPIPPEHGRRLAQLQQRHTLARLAMLQRRQDLDREIRKVRTGKKLLAYRQLN